MLDRRRFLALSVGSGSLAAVAPGVSASAAVPLWRSATWTARVGTSLDLVDAAGRHIPVVVAGVRTNATQAGTSGESFTVTFTSGRDVSEATTACAVRIWPVHGLF